MRRPMVREQATAAAAPRERCECAPRWHDEAADGMWLGEERFCDDGTALPP